ncbi:MAG TPA: DUF885 domain-containing protein [Kofleriaceae bacterium]|nr:DUF885 domain-containing protein [Kofleriaceae bacterium]
MFRRRGRAIARALALVLLLAGLAAPRSAAASRSGGNLAGVADDYFWALQKRLLRPNFSPRANKAWVAKLAGYQRRLGQIRHANLDQQERITYRMLTADLRSQREYVEHGWIARDVNGTESPAQTYAALDVDKMRTVADWKWTIKTLKNSQRFMDSYIRMLEVGLDAGGAQPREAIESTIRSLDIMTSADPKQNPFLAMDAALVANMAGKPQLPALQAELHAVVHDLVIPSHRRLRTFLSDRYLPRAGKLGADRAGYLHAMEEHLGPDHPTPEALNAWGRSEVIKLQKELDRTARLIRPNMKSLSAFMVGLGQRKDNRYGSAQELIDHTYSEIKRTTKLARQQMPVPRSTVTVTPVAPYQEATVAAQYFSPDYGKGVMQVNIGPLLASTRKNDLATLTAHEVTPGHHQAAMMAQKGEDKLSMYRSGRAETTFDEGWGLYAERLRDEMDGFTPEERVGYLTGHLWRAARLVVDTGLHTGTMTPAQARTYFGRATFISKDQAATEIARYIDWPGQALAYYVGEAKILKIRRQVKKILGPHFDPRGFHAKLLSSSSIPLDELSGVMISWANRRKGQVTRSPAAQRLTAAARAAAPPRAQATRPAVKPRHRAGSRSPVLRARPTKGAKSARR